VSLETTVDELAEFVPEAFRRESQRVGATLLCRKSIRVPFEAIDGRQ
jgi:hypothetical protein